jgi:hypothetical protein
MPRIGDKQFAVNWTTDVPDDGFGGHDFDAGISNTKSFKTLAEAKRFAKKIFPKDFFGEVMIDEDVFEPYDEYDLRPNVGFWETLKTIYYDGEGFS